MSFLYPTYQDVARAYRRGDQKAIRRFDRTNPGFSARVRAVRAGLSTTMSMTAEVRKG